LGDGAALPSDLDVVDVLVVIDLDIDHDLVPAQGIEPLGPVGRWRLELTPVPGAPIVVEDYLSVEIFET
jgi:hypothetical protein